MNLLAKLISIIFHPLLLATYLFALFGKLYPPAIFPVTERGFMGILLLIFITTFMLPAINVYFFKIFGTISSVSMPLRRERIAPFLMISLLYGVVTYLLHEKIGLGWQDTFMKFLLLIDVLVVSAFVITLFMKASIHSLSMSAMTIIMVVLNNSVENGIFFYPMLLTILLSGLVMTARLYLQVHTLKEVLVGSVIGILVAAGGMMILF